VALPVGTPVPSSTAWPAPCGHRRDRVRQL